MSAFNDTQLGRKSQQAIAQESARGGGCTYCLTTRTAPCPPPDKTPFDETSPLPFIHPSAALSHHVAHFLGDSLAFVATVAARSVVAGEGE